MKNVKWFPFVLVLLFPGYVNAIPCNSGALNGLVNTTCTIGDKTFTFGTLTGTIPAAQIQFVPNASNPLQPSFVLSPVTGALTVSTSGAQIANLSADLAFTVATTSGFATMLGTTITLGQATASGTNAQNFAIVDAFNFFGSGATQAHLSSGALPEVCIETPTGGPTGCVGPPFPSSVSATGTFGPPFPTLLNTASGDLGFSLHSEGIASATFVSATFAFNQVAQVTQPSAVVLFGLGVVAISSLANRKRPRP